MFWNQPLIKFKSRSTDHLEKVIDDIFDDTLSSFRSNWKMSTISDRHGVEDTETHQRIHIAVPGHKADTVNVATDPIARLISVTAQPGESSNAFIAGGLELEFAVPSNLDIDEVEAEVSDGVLIVSIQKLKKKDSKPKTVQVKVK
jgi:HSP20 family molecular chaperone IbpA